MARWREDYCSSDSGPAEVALRKEAAQDHPRSCAAA